MAALYFIIFFAAATLGSFASAVTVSRTGSSGFDFLPAVADVSLDGYCAVFELDEFFDVSDLRDTEFFSQLRADLGGVAVDGLPAAKDDIVFELFDGAA